MTRSAPAPGLAGRAYAGRAGSIMRFNAGDTAHTQPQCHSQKQQAVLERVGGCTVGNTTGCLGVQGGEKRGGVVGAKGPEEVMKRGFVLLWAALGFSRHFSHVAANSAASSFIFLHSEQRLDINQHNHQPPSPRRRWPVGYRLLKKQTEQYVGSLSILLA